jgi:hypothetical protein
VRIKIIIMYMIVKKDGCVSDSWEYDCEGYLKRRFEELIIRYKLGWLSVHS